MALYRTYYRIAVKNTRFPINSLKGEVIWLGKSTGEITSPFSPMIFLLSVLETLSSLGLHAKKKKKERKNKF